MSYCYSSRLYRARAAAGRCTVQEPLLAACTVQQEDPCHALCLLAWRVRGVYIAFAWRARGVCMACAWCVHSLHTPRVHLQVGYGTDYVSPQEAAAMNASVVTLHQGIPGVVNGALVQSSHLLPLTHHTWDHAHA